MFEIEFKQLALEALRRMKRFHSTWILQAIERHLRQEPERISRTTIKKLRGKQLATYRLRVGEYRVYYDVKGGMVTVLAILHKAETARFHLEEETS